MTIKRKTTTIRLPDDAWESLREAAFRQRKSMGFLVRKYVAEGLKRDQGVQRMDAEAR